MITNAYRAMSTPRCCGPSVNGLGPAAWGAGSTSTEVMAPHTGGKRSSGEGARSRSYGYVTVTYATVARPGSPAHEMGEALPDFDAFATGLHPYGTVVEILMNVDMYPDKLTGQVQPRRKICTLSIDMV
ncbi:hypothetical protein KRMM14A1259_35890 [Krasilnikovia sp. MM14-A1259]